MAFMTMLELGDVIKIGNDIEIKYVKKLGRKVGVGIIAQDEIKIIRVRKRPEKIKNENDGHCNR